MAVNGKILAVFDFDHTLVDGNTDTWVTKMHSPTKQLMRKLQQNGWCWTDIMGEVFRVLSSNNLKQENYVKCLETLKFLPGMKETCNFLRSKGVPSIIISDSNSYFIDHLLWRESFHELFANIYTNPARWDVDGCLLVDRYQNNDFCSTCPLNLCKKEVLQSYLKEHIDQNFERVVYIGDGLGDFCPCSSLSETGFVLAREGYKLLEYIQNEKSSEVKAKIIPWSSGFEVLQFFQTLTNK